MAADQEVTSRYRKVADDIKAAIAAGGYAAGTRLPSEHELAERYSVSRGTIRQAFAALRADGVIASRRGARRVVVGGPRGRAAGGGHGPGEGVDHQAAGGTGRRCRRRLPRPGGPAQLLLVQRTDGGLTVGDTHEYAEPFAFDVDEDAYGHLRVRAEALLGGPIPQVQRLWAGLEPFACPACPRREIMC